MLARLKEPLDAYHQRRADKHGWIYFILKEVSKAQGPAFMDPETKTMVRIGSLYEARSIATGVVCTFRTECMELLEDAVQEPQGPELP